MRTITFAVLTSFIFAACGDSGGTADFDATADIANDTPGEVSDNPIGTGQQVSALIGPDGGALSLDGVILDVPPGALAEPITLTLTSTREPAPNGYDAYTPTFRLEPTDLVFAQPATLTVPFVGDNRVAVLFWGRHPNYQRLGGAPIDGALCASLTRLGQGFVGNGVDYSAVADRTCVVTRLLEGRTVEPSGVALFFWATDCQGRPIVDLATADIALREGDARVSAEGQQQLFDRKGLQIVVSLTIDLSSSTGPLLGTVIAASKHFVDTLEARGVPALVGIDVFAGGAQSQAWLVPTLDLSRVRAQLDALATFTPADPMSTNLYGAVISSLGRVRSAATAFRERNHGGAFTAGYVVVFTDGGDTAGLVAPEALAEARRAGPEEVVAIGLKDSADFDPAVLERIAPGAVLASDTSATLERDFAAVASNIAGLASRTYMVGYCSPKRAGQHTVSIDVAGASMSQSASYVFDASGFQGGCGLASFDTCGDSECGGLGCGACDDRTGTCAADTGRCVSHCAQRALCGGESITTDAGYTMVCAATADNSACFGACVDTLTDEGNCGGCGIGCDGAAGESCVDGLCVCPGAGGTICDGRCRDLATDNESCGACGLVCERGQICDGGTCECPGVMGQECDGLCRDLLFDKDHCGACGRGCPIACEQGVCSDDPPGYRKLAPGQFVMGSPESELGRSESSEMQHIVTLTRGFWLKATEVTRAEWRQIMGELPTSLSVASSEDCTDETCPVSKIDWWSALTYLNALSRAEGREECYELDGCTGDGADGEMSCIGATRFKGLDCTGYRLPTEAEWEYAARAGTTTATYNGDLTTAVGRDPVVDAIAWYGSNTDVRCHTGPPCIQPVARKIPNEWGFYDMLGNVGEWTQDTWLREITADPATDPLITNPALDGLVVVKGAAYSDRTEYLRSARRTYYGRSDGYYIHGLRSARTVAP